MQTNFGCTTYNIGPMTRGVQRNTYIYQITQIVYDCSVPDSTGYLYPVSLKVLN